MSRDTDIPKRDSELNNRGPVNDKDRVRQLFMESPYLEFAEFARHQGWAPKDSQNFPIREWILEKRKILGKEEAERLAQTIFEHKGSWHNEVLKTLKTYPTLIDNMTVVIAARQREWIEMIRGDEEITKRATLLSGNERLKTLAGRQFPKVKTSDLVSLTMAIKTVTEAKHKSLLIDDWSVQLAERFSSARMVDDDKGIIEVNPEESWNLVLRGGEKMTKKDIQDFMLQYYDPPVKTEGVADGTDG